MYLSALQILESTNNPRNEDHYPIIQDNDPNMRPGDPYREWFHNTISRSHYSLGEATAHYNQWISDPDYGPNPRLNRHHNNDLPSYLPQVHHSSSS
jgi:hypothetical protein